MTELLDQLRLVRDRMADPERVVINALDLYENSDGGYVSMFVVGRELEQGREPCRACLLGWERVAADITTERVEHIAIGDADSLLHQAVIAAATDLGIEPDSSRYGDLETQLTGQGRAVEVLDHAIEMVTKAPT